MIEQVKLKAGRYRIPASLEYVGDRIFVRFRYSKALISEVKAMRGNRWHGFDKPPKKVWSIENCPRNHFQLDYLQGKNPYAHFDQSIVQHDYQRPLYQHQKEMADFIQTRRHCIIAGEIGVGKTLAAIEAMERSAIMDWWYVSPKSGLRATNRELKIWKSLVRPRMMTYEAVVKWVREHEGQEVIPPQGIVFDESARAKNPTAQRSQAAMELANLIREHWGYDGYIVLMSGAPAPKDPADWWHQCEIACPGFLREGTQMKLRRRLAVITEQQGAGGVYPSLQTWLDNSKKCIICGEFEDYAGHDKCWCSANDEEYHEFQESKDEVSFLNKRMGGLVIIKLKSECLDLPEVHYQKIHLKPSQQILNLAKSILTTASTVISGITLLRELSDGFQYRNEEIGEEDCRVCKGTGKIIDPLNNDEIIDCDGCGGKKRVPITKRVTIQVESPKAEAFSEILDSHSDTGRLVVYAGFTGAIDRCVEVSQKMGWEVIRADGRGWWNSIDKHLDPLDIFQDHRDKFPRVVFIGQPGAAGSCITLTASPTIVYYSNTFDGDHRIQSEGRGHRPGMDLIRGLTIIDLIHLPTDELLLSNLKEKKRLQALTMGDLAKALE